MSFTFGDVSAPQKIHIDQTSSDNRCWHTGHNKYIPESLASCTAAASASLQTPYYCLLDDGRFWMIPAGVVVSSAIDAVRRLLASLFIERSELLCRPAADATSKWLREWLANKQVDVGYITTFHYGNYHDWFLPMKNSQDLKSATKVCLVETETTIADQCILQLLHYLTLFNNLESYAKINLVWNYFFITSRSILTEPRSLGVSLPPRML